LVDRSTLAATLEFTPKRHQTHCSLGSPQDAAASLVGPSADYQFGRCFSATKVTGKLSGCHLTICCAQSFSVCGHWVDSWLDWHCVCRRRSRWRTSGLSLVRLESDCFPEASNPCPGILTRPPQSRFLSQLPPFPVVDLSPAPDAHLPDPIDPFWLKAEVLAAKKDSFLPDSILFQPKRDVEK
jgi:hypothetical protein